MEIYAVGLDVGGTKIAGGLVNLSSGQILAKQVIPTRPERGGEVVLKDTLRLAEGLLAEAKTLKLEVLGIGLGVAELVDLAGNITSAHTIAWQNLPVQKTLSHLAPAVVESDVRAAALGEGRYGAGRPFNLFAYVTVGTGISYCLVQAGQPYAGAHGNALILASSPLTTICPDCGTTITPILEEFASGPALVARYNQQASALKEAKSQPGFQVGLSQIPEMWDRSEQPFQAVPQIWGIPLRTGQEALAAVEAGDEIAIDIVRTAGEALGVSAGWLVNVLDPEALIVGGGLGVAGGLYWDSFVNSTRRHIWSESNRDLPILMAALGPDAGVIGAAAVWAKKLNS